MLPWVVMPSDNFLCGVNALKVFLSVILGKPHAPLSSKMRKRTPWSFLRQRVKRSTPTTLSPRLRRRTRSHTPKFIGQDSVRVLTRTLGEYFSGGDPVSSHLSVDHHGPLLTYSPRLLRPLGLPLHGPPITAGHVSPHRLTKLVDSTNTAESSPSESLRSKAITGGKSQRARFVEAD